ncbi:unnamed protein product [Caenorhabditis bovis]|uniref:Uncharacterized protein n=1 Tax=Caenorhabditis bovis TaxID=2654633 RepID=A0A8S1EQQ2_9PELO|nr:unnamed protein product [Caenorhabditis bovis]
MEKNEEDENRRFRKFIVEISVLLNDRIKKGCDKIQFRDFERDYEERIGKIFKKRMEHFAKSYPAITLTKLLNAIPKNLHTFKIETDENGIQWIIANSKNTTAVSEDPTYNAYEETIGSRIVFSLPTWPWATNAFRENEREKYELAISRRDPIECWKLAREWWGPHVPKLSQLLLILKRVGCERIELTRLDSYLSKAAPPVWCGDSKTYECNYEVFGVSKSKLAQLNLLVRCDAKNRNLVTINKIIHFIEFREISNPLTAYIYDYALNYPGATSDEISEMLFHHGFKLGTSEEGCRNVLKEALNDPENFVVERRRIHARLYDDHAVVPMFFSPYNDDINTNCVH